MNRDEKAAAVAEIGAELKESKAVFAVDYRGISVPQAAELRGKLREADASFSVVKNRLAKRAAAEAGATELDEHLVGPTALTYIKGDPVIAAKTVADFTRANEILAYKGGLMDGAFLDPDQFKAISVLPGVDVLRGRLVAVAAAPLTGVVRTLNQLIAGLASQLGQLAEQGVLGGDASTPAEEAKVEQDGSAEEAKVERAGDDDDAASEDAAPAEETKDSGDEDESRDSGESEDEETEQAPEASGDDAEAGSGDEKED